MSSFEQCPKCGEVVELDVRICPSCSDIINPEAASQVLTVKPAGYLPVASIAEWKACVPFDFRTRPKSQQCEAMLERLRSRQVKSRKVSIVVVQAAPNRYRVELHFHDYQGEISSAFESDVFVLVDLKRPTEAALEELRFIRRAAYHAGINPESIDDHLNSWESPDYPSRAERRELYRKRRDPDPVPEAVPYTPPPLTEPWTTARIHWADDSRNTKPSKARSEWEERLTLLFTDRPMAESETELNSEPDDNEHLGRLQQRIDFLERELKYSRADEKAIRSSLARTDLPARTREKAAHRLNDNNRWKAALELQIEHLKLKLRQLKVS